MTAMGPNAGGVPLQPGDRVGNYEVVGQIGAGGYSIVWKGRDALLQRDVAIKQLLATGATDAEDEALAQRFRQEVDLQRKLSDRHAGVVKVLDYVESAQGRFIVMEYVDGGTLEQTLTKKGEPLKLPTTAKVLVLIAEALQSIHAEGVIHRDLKPSNVLLPQGGTVKLCDLGLASLVADQEALTIGSVRYMSPELCLGEPADARADVYSLGMIAYEMIAGRNQFNEAFKSVVRDQNRQAMRWVKWHTNRRLAPPSLMQLNDQCPPWLSELVTRMLEKDPLKRIASAADVAAVIDREVNAAATAKAEKKARRRAEKQAAAASASGLPVPTAAAGVGDAFGGPYASVPAPAVTHVQAGRGTGAAATPREEHTAPLPTRARWPVVLASLVILACLAGGGFWVYDSMQRGRADAERRTEAASLMREAQTQYRAGAFAEAADTYRRVAANWSDLSSIARSAEAGQLLAEARLLIEGGDHAEARARLLRLDEMDIVSRDEVYDLIEEADRRATFIDQARQIETAIADGRFAEARRMIRDWRALTLAAEEEERLNELRVRLEDQVSQRLVEDAHREAQELADTGRLDQAIERLTAAQERFRSPRLQTLLERLTDQQRFARAVQRGEALLAEGNRAGAIDAFAEALAIRSDETLDQRVRRLRSEHAIAEGRRLMGLGDTAGAREAFAQSLGYGDSAEARSMLAQLDVEEQKQVFVRAGDAAMRRSEYEAAVEQYRRALEFGEDGELERKHAVARASRLVAEGDRHLRAGELDDARRSFEAAQAIAAGVAGADAGLETIARQTRYRRHLEAGDRYRAASQFTQAQLEYRRAREVIDTAEARERMVNAEFDHYIAQARSFIAAEEWRAAQAVLDIAARIRTDEVVESLMRQVERRDTGERRG
jgi:tRNA A-37 threonylcarbamoyl transferase component Bud32/tetratricopeptide (TPR) repeat protein